jgi:hypothetical protein
MLRFGVTFAALAFVTIALSGCQADRPKTAAELMQEFKNDSQGALQRYQYRTVAFTGVLKRPPWEKAIYQYEGGKEALVYFVTDKPDEWFFCITDYRESLRELREGDRYLVSGIVYRFESEGKLFLTKCSLEKLD